MKATGIVRRIDDLGRVVIPKEIRRTMNIREGDPLEIFTAKEGIVFAPYVKNDEQKYQAARNWLSTQKLALEANGAKFTIFGTTTSCEVIVCGRRKMGEARLCVGDTFDPAIGMVVSYCHAIGVSIPPEIFGE